MPQICFLYIHFGVRGAVQEVVYGNFVKFRQLDKGGGRDVDIAPLVVTVDPLAAGENLPHLGLSQVFVLPKVPYSGIQRHNKYTPTQ